MSCHVNMLVTALPAFHISQWRGATPFSLRYHSCHLIHVIYHLILVMSFSFSQKGDRPGNPLGRSHRGRQDRRGLRGARGPELQNNAVRNQHHRKQIENRELFLQMNVMTVLCLFIFKCTFVKLTKDEQNTGMKTAITNFSILIGHR